MRQYVAKPGQECKSELIVGAGLERVRWTAWYLQLWWLVQWNQGGHQGKMVLEMPSENRQCQGRGNMGGQLIPDTRCRGWKRFWSGHWCFPQWCRYGYRRGGPEWSWRCVSWKNLNKVQRLLMVQYLESSCGNFEIDSMANREPVQAGQNWRDVAVPRLLCKNSSKGVLDHLNASKIWCGCACKKRITIVEPRADYCHGYRFCCFSGQGWTNVAQSSNVEIWCLTNLGNMLIERHMRV